MLYLNTFKLIGLINILRRIRYGISVNFNNFIKPLTRDSLTHLNSKYYDEEKFQFRFHNIWLKLSKKDFILSCKDKSYLNEILKKDYSDLLDIESLDAGDIKIFWELNRLYFLLDDKNGIVENDYRLDLLFEWLFLCKTNKHDFYDCKHEVSIRCIHIIYFHKLHSIELSNTVLSFLENSLLEIKKSIYYSISQQNNHSLTELYAIYILSEILNKKNVKKHLSRFISYLNIIYSDGGTSQQSYHYALVISRLLMFHTYYIKTHLTENSMIEKKLHKIANYLNNPALIQVGGYGQNDGSMFLHIFDRDIIKYEKTIKDGAVVSKQYKNSGLFTFISHKYSMVQRFPSYTHKLSHADYLSISLTWKGVDIFCDRGVTSYAKKPYDLPLDHNMPFLPNAYSKKLTRFVLALAPRGGGEINENMLVKVFLNNTLNKRFFERKLKAETDNINFKDRWTKKNFKKGLQFFTECDVMCFCNLLILKSEKVELSIVYKQNVNIEVTKSTRATGYLMAEKSITKVQVTLREGEVLEYKIQERN